ncbi:MAG: Tat pathway signal protein [Paracoccaceae bacterium]|nr:Tat pathway signal protein [Paracoccaceae bacterium]
MPNLNRRIFLAVTVSGAAVRALPSLATKPAGKRILTLVYDKSLGMMRAVDRLVK